MDKCLPTRTIDGPLNYRRLVVWVLDYPLSIHRFKGQMQGPLQEPLGWSLGVVPIKFKPNYNPIYVPHIFTQFYHSKQKTLYWSRVEYGLHDQLPLCMQVLSSFSHMVYLLVSEKFYDVQLVVWNTIYSLHDQALRMLVSDSLGLLKTIT